MTRPTKRTAGPVLVAAAGALLLAGCLAGCGVGLNPQTYAYRAAANSTNVDAGPLSVRNVYVPAPDASGYLAGANADVVLSAATRADKDDRLVSATSDGASSVEVPDDLVVPVGGLMLDKRITLVGLTRTLRSSDYVVVRLSFESGANVTVNTPVAVGSDAPDTRPGFEEPETDSNGVPIAGEPEATEPAASPTSLGTAP